jgi:hypothetical protein
LVTSLKGTRHFHKHDTIQDVQLYLHIPSWSATKALRFVGDGNSGSAVSIALHAKSPEIASVF